MEYHVQCFFEDILCDIDHSTMDPTHVKHIADNLESIWKNADAST